MSDRRIKISYTTRTPPENEEENGWVDDSKSGWENEEGVSAEPDEVEREAGLTAVDKAIDLLKGEGWLEPLGRFFHVGIEYSTEFVLDLYTGVETERIFHLHGFTPDEELAIYRAVRPKSSRLGGAQVAAAPHGRCANRDHCIEPVARGEKCKTKGRKR